MVNLDEKRLKQRFLHMNKDQKQKLRFESKWHSIVAFLHKNLGYKIAKVARIASKANVEGSRDSDLDIIFYTARDQNQDELLAAMRKLIKKNYKKEAQIKKLNIGVQISFKSTDCVINVIYLAKEQFDSEYKEALHRGLVPKEKQIAIILIKYAFFKAAIDFITGPELEIACITSECNTIKGCVNSTIHHFSGKLNQQGTSVNNILKFLR